MRLRLRHGLLWLGAALTLGVVFLAYLAPEMAVTLANGLWACF